MEQAKALGYSSEINQLAFFAVVSLLDESVLKLQSPAFADWAQRPMQEEMFGHNRAGEVFFDNLRTLLARQDSQETADCLEVYCLCMLLGFKGKYALAPSITTFVSGQGNGGAWGQRPGGEIQALIRQAREKIDRIRGPVSFLPDAARAAGQTDCHGRSLEPRPRHRRPGSCSSFRFWPSEDSGSFSVRELRTSGDAAPSGVHHV